MHKKREAISWRHRLTRYHRDVLTRWTPIAMLPRSTGLPAAMLHDPLHSPMPASLAAVAIARKTGARPDLNHSRAYIKPFNPTLPAVSAPQRNSHGRIRHGGTGYLGRAMIGRLLSRGHAVRALARPASLDRELPGAAAGDRRRARLGDVCGRTIHTTTLVHLVGTPHPAPSKATEFQRVDLASDPVERRGRRAVHDRAPRLRQRCAAGARDAGLASAARAMGEAAIVEREAHRDDAATLVCASGRATGGRSRWKPFYWLGERLPATRGRRGAWASSRWRKMVAALVQAVEYPPRHRNGTRIVEVPDTGAAWLS